MCVISHENMKKQKKNSCFSMNFLYTIYKKIKQNKKTNISFSRRMKQNEAPSDQQQIQQKS